MTIAAASIEVEGDTWVAKTANYVQPGLALLEDQEGNQKIALTLYSPISETHAVEFTVVGLPMINELLDQITELRDAALVAGTNMEKLATILGPKYEHADDTGAMIKVPGALMDESTAAFE